MNDSRRDFLKKAALLAGGTGLWATLPPSLQKAVAITPDPGTTFHDAEHVVLLMQENRSFDHCFGTMRGVRGFNDPRAITLPNGHKVWFQKDRGGNIFPPFRLNIKDTRATWMGGVPHSWEDQVDAFNQGRNDGWLEAKRPGNEAFKHIPLTMGYYQREDIPFYHAFADAFTVCDQHFCASLTGTTTNRNYFWTGKTHGKKGEKPKVRNGEMGYNNEVNWNTFPEILEKEGISWKVYQNELSISTELEGEDKSLLANFTNNNLEWFKQYGVRFSPGHYRFLQKREKEIPEEIGLLEVRLKNSGENKPEIQEELDKKRQEWEGVKEGLGKWNPEKFKQLSQLEQKLHQKGLLTNVAYDDYHQTETLKYQDNGEDREVKVPKGDILYEFRKDAENGTLPTVSWLVAPQRFSDHPSAPWYGAWYISEVLDILTKDPELWKKTIFILNYDENDGYFDHIPPFVPPHPHDPRSGKVSSGLSTEGEFVTLDEEMQAGFAPERSREAPVGLGFRVPLIVASPWSRGGWVNSQVCDITSTIKFLEVFLSKKTGKKIFESNISTWRREISGDLTSIFRPFNGEEITLPEFLDRDRFVKSIYNARFKGLPDNFRNLNEGEAREGSEDPWGAGFVPTQERGIKPSSALFYELYADGGLSQEKGVFKLNFQASDKRFGKKAWGVPFQVFAPGKYLDSKTNQYEPVKVWSFAVKAGDKLEFEWPLAKFENDLYHLQAHGPNGFFREFRGDEDDPQISVSCHYLEEDKKRGLGKVALKIRNSDTQRPVQITVSDNAYKNPVQKKTLVSSGEWEVLVETAHSHGWYDFSLQLEGSPTFLRRFAGRVEFGKPSQSDPFMGGVV